MVVRVDVPVTVVDRRGQPVRGLTREDFRLLDEGTEQELVDFDVVDLAGEHAGGVAARSAVPSVSRRHFMLLFDFSFSSPSAILRARLAAREFVLHSLHPADLAAVAVVSLETGPQLVVTFTPDRAQLARAIDNLELDRRPGQSQDPLRFILAAATSSVASAGSDEDLASGRNALKAQIREMGNESARVVSRQIERGEMAYERSRVSGWSRSLATLGQALGAVPGRKHIVYFSEGFDGELLLGRRLDPGSAEANEDFLDRIQGRLWMVDNDDLTGSSHLQADVAEMLEAFRRSDSVIHAVDIAGLRDGQRGAGTRANQDALFFVANETGGELFEDTNDLSAQLERVLTRSTVTYTLAFQPQVAGESNRYHRLKVQLRSGPGGYRISHRPGYFEPRPFPELHPLEKNLLAADAIAAATPRTEIALQVLAAPFRSGGGLAYVPVIVEIEGRSLLASQATDSVRVEVYAYATDAHGAMVGFFAQSIELGTGGARSKLLESGLKYYGHLELPAGEQLIRVLVRNAATGRTGVATRALTIPDYVPPATALLPPFFIESPSRWLLVREPPAEGARGSVVYPFTVNGEPYVPSARPLLQVGESADFCLVAYHLGEGVPSIQAWLVDGAGRLDPGGQLFLVERTVTGISGVDKLLARFLPEHIAAGDYTLMVALVDPASGLESQSSIPISVVR